MQYIGSYQVYVKYWFIAGFPECVCGVGCNKQFSFEYRNKCEIHLMSNSQILWNILLFLSLQRALAPGPSVPPSLVITQGPVFPFGTEDMPVTVGVQATMGTTAK